MVRGLNTTSRSLVRSFAPEGAKSCNCVSRSPLLVAVGDSSAIKVVRRQLDLDPVPRQDADVVAPHLARDMAEHLVPVVELDLEHRVREGLDHLALHLDLLFLRQTACDPSLWPRDNAARVGYSFLTFTAF